MSIKTLKWAAILCFIVAMVVLLGGGVTVKKDLPPYPGKVVDSSSNVLIRIPDRQLTLPAICRLLVA